MSRMLMTLMLSAAIVCGGHVFAGEAKKGILPPIPVTVVVDGATNVYDLAAIADSDAAKGAKSYIGAYADNVQNDKAFAANEAKALATIRGENRFFGTWWAIFPSLLAIFLALVTKEVYSSLFVGIVAGGAQAPLFIGFPRQNTGMG